MSYLDNQRSVPRCDPCGLFFRSWKEKREHDSNLHDRYESTDSQRYSWDQNRGNMTKAEKDYFVCGTHAKKLNDDFRCPIKNCLNNVFIRKSEYIKVMQEKNNS